MLQTLADAEQDRLKPPRARRKPHRHNCPLPGSGLSAYRSQGDGVFVYGALKKKADQVHRTKNLGTTEISY